eukprot:g1745.t1
MSHSEDADTDDFDLWTLFREAEKVAGAIDRGEMTSTDLEYMDAILKLDRCANEIVRRAIFSKNEDVDDIKTQSLELMLTNFYLGQLNAVAPMKRGPDGSLNMRHRLYSVRKASFFYTKFLSLCEANRILSKETKSSEEWRMFKGDVDKGNVHRNLSREARIAQHRRRKAIKAKIASLRKLKTDARDESLERSLSISILQDAIESGLSTILRLAQEEDMLKISTKERPEERARGRDSRLRSREIGHRGGGDGVSSGLSSSRGLQITRIEPRPGAMPSTLSRAVAGGDKHVVATFRGNAISGGMATTGGASNLIMKREIFKDGVFKPDHRLPTMSLEEFAALEVENAKKRSERAQNRPKGPRRMEQLRKDGDEDDESLADTAALLDREWDDWKDDNPKGSGVTKRF